MAKLKRPGVSTGHGTGRLIQRDLHEILQDSKIKRRRRWMMLSQRNAQLTEIARHAAQVADAAKRALAEERSKSIPKRIAERVKGFTGRLFGRKTG